jgi:hypothetical protein
MFRRIALRHVLLVLALMICVQPLTADSSIQRLVVPAEGQPEGTYQVLLEFPPGQVWGVRETFSPGVTFISADLPDDSVQKSAREVHFALIDRQNVSYTITLDPGISGEITGTCQNMVTGMTGTLPRALISGSGSIDIESATGEHPVSDDRAQARTASLGSGILMAALCSGGLLYMLRRKNK